MGTKSEEIQPTNIEIHSEAESEVHNRSQSSPTGSSASNKYEAEIDEIRSEHQGINSEAEKKSTIPLTPTNSLNGQELNSDNNDSVIQTTQIPTRPEFKFDPDSYIYMANACCELLHYRVAAIIVGGLEILLLLVWLCFSALFYSEIGTESFGAYLAITAQLIVGSVAVASISMMFLGVWKEKPYLLWPHMVFQISGIGLGIILTVIAVVSMAAGTHIAEAVFGKIFGHNNLPLVEKTLGPIWPFCLAVIFDFGAAVGIWYYILVRGAYDYLLDKKFFETHSVQHVVMEEKTGRKEAPKAEQLQRGLEMAATPVHT